MPLDLRVLRKLRPRKHRPQTPGCLEYSDPQYFSNITTNHSPRATSPTFATTKANGFAEISPERKFALAKSRQNQIFDLG